MLVLVVFVATTLLSTALVPFASRFATVVISKWMGELNDQDMQLVLDGGLERHSPEPIRRHHTV